MEKQLTQSPDTALEILLLGLGNKLYGVPLKNVRYVARVDPSFAASGAGVADYFVFEGEPLTYVSLWDALGAESAYTEYHELQSMLPQRKQDHLDWMAALEQSLRQGVPFTKARSPRECAFGKWYYAHNTDDLRLETILRQFDQPHARIHGLADQLLGLADAGQRDEALRLFERAKQTTLSELLKLFESACQLVVELQRRVAIVVAEGDASCALGADMIRNIVTVPVERIKRNASHSAAVSVLAILDDQSVVPVLNWEALMEQSTITA